MTGNSDVTRLGKGCRQYAQNLVCRFRQNQFPVACVELRQQHKDIIANLLQEVIDAAIDSLAEDL
jgi:hypothetical protein